MADKINAFGAGLPVPVTRGNLGFGDVDYLRWQDATDAFSAECDRRGWTWDSEVVSATMLEAWAIVHVRVHVWRGANDDTLARGGGIMREALAAEPLGKGGNAPPLETAERTALKRAFALFGLRAETAARGSSDWSDWFGVDALALAWKTDVQSALQSLEKGEKSQQAERRSGADGKTEWRTRRVGR